MSKYDCRLLDDYLSGELGEVAHEGFQQHLLECPTCCEEVALQQSIDDALRQAHNAIKPPKSLTEHVGRAFVEDQKATSRVLLLCAAAAVLLVVGGSALLWYRSIDRSTPSPQSQPRVAKKETGQDPKGSDQEANVRISFPDTQPAIAERMITKDPTVTIFLIHPVYTSSSTKSL